MRHRPRKARSLATSFATSRLSSTFATSRVSAAFATSRATAALMIVVALGIGEACGGRGSEPKPVAMLASSPEAAAAFDAIRETWEQADRSPDIVLRVAVRARLERFLAEYPRDGLVPLARVALAVDAMNDGAMATADAQLALTKDLPPGTANDLRTVAVARRARLGGDPETGLTLLRPLVGKTVDPLVRTLFEEELTVTALATHREYEAISYMDAWLRASTDEEKAATVAHVSAIVQRLPRPVLVGALQAMSSQRASLGYGPDIQRILAVRLVEVATTSGDAELARALLEADPQAFTEAGDAGVALGELAASRRGLNVVEGRTLGLLLPTASPGLRDESADVLRGVLWALGLPRGTRTPVASSSDASAASKPSASAASNPSASAKFGPPALENAGAPAGFSACAPLEPAPPLNEPSDDDGVRLVTRDDAGREDRTEVSLDELAGEGAAVIIAGLDAQTAERALKWGGQHNVPVVVLVPPADGVANTPFGFVLGEQRAKVIDALVHAAPALANELVAPVADASEIESYTPQGGTVGPLRFGPPVSCDVPATQAGEVRFPIPSWQADKTHAWLVSGSLDCAEDLEKELASSRARGVIALTLEASSRLRAVAGLHVVGARAGIIPEVDVRDPRADEVQRFSSAGGRAGWWTALGRDAATIARSALLSLPTDLVSEARAVSDRRATARDRLTAAHARLWTTESSGWNDDRTMGRVVCTLDVAAR